MTRNWGGEGACPSLALRAVWVGGEGVAQTLLGCWDRVEAASCAGWAKSDRRSV